MVPGCAPSCQCEQLCFLVRPDVREQLTFMLPKGGSHCRGLVLGCEASSNCHSNERSNQCSCPVNSSCLGLSRVTALTLSRRESLSLWLISLCTVNGHVLRCSWPQLQLRATMSAVCPSEASLLWCLIAKVLKTTSWCILPGS